MACSSSLSPSSVPGMDRNPEILHTGAPGDLTAEGVFLNHKYALSRPAGISRGSQPRGAAADDENIKQHKANFLSMT